LEPTRRKCVIHRVKEEEPEGSERLHTAKKHALVHAADAGGRAILRKRLKQSQISDYFANLPKGAGMKTTQEAPCWSG